MRGILRTKRFLSVCCCSGRTICGKCTGNGHVTILVAKCDEFLAMAITNAIQKCEPFDTLSSCKFNNNKINHLPVLIMITTTINEEENNHPEAVVEVEQEEVPPQDV